MSCARFDRPATESDCEELPEDGKGSSFVAWWEKIIANNKESG